MNARAIRKRLMRGRRGSFWGERAYLSVRLPRDVAGQSPPTFIPEGFVSDGWEGSWKSPDGLTTVHIGKASSNIPPEEIGDERRLFIQPSESDGWYDFWSGYISREVGRDENDRPVFEQSEVPEGWVARYKVWREWLDALHGYGVSPLMDAFVEAGQSAKSMEVGVSEDALTILYGVKWFYADRKLRFCADLSKAVRMAHSMGIRGRLR